MTVQNVSKLVLSILPQRTNITQDGVKLYFIYIFIGGQAYQANGVSGYFYFSSPTNKYDTFEQRRLQ